METPDKKPLGIRLRQENLSIAAKGWILVATPIISSFILLSALLFLVQQSEKEAWREARGKALLAEINTLSGQFVHCSEAMVLYQVLKSRKALKRYEESAAEIPQQMHRIRQLALLMPNESRRKYVREVGRLSEKGLQALDRSRQCFSSEGALLNTAETRRIAEELKEFLNEFVEAVEKLNLQEQRAEVEGILLAGQSRKLLQSAIIAGFLITILLAFFQHRFFSKSLLARLQLILENTRLLARHKPMNAPLEGSDEIRELDQSFHEMAQRLEELESLKRQFVATVSHDLRTPIASVRMTHDLLLCGYVGELSPQAEKKLAAATKTLDRLLQMINRLLDLEKMEQTSVDLELSNVPVILMFESIRESAGDLLSSSNLELVFENTDVTVRCDPQLIHQVLMNLVGNAIKFSPAKTHITLAVETDDDGMAKISVRDQGPGIPAESLASIFERFKQVDSKQDSKRGGLGLGLAICKSIVDAHGTQIGVTSELGRGSEFWFALPVVPAQPDTGENAADQLAKESDQ